MAKAKLGNKCECHACGAKFYDFNKSEIVCPQCGTDQNATDEEEQIRRRLEAEAELNEDSDDLEDEESDDLEDEEEDEEIEDERGRLGLGEDDDDLEDEEEEEDEEEDAGDGNDYDDYG